MLNINQFNEWLLEAIQFVQEYKNNDSMEFNTNSVEEMYQILRDEDLDILLEANDGFKAKYLIIDLNGVKYEVFITASGEDTVFVSIDYYNKIMLETVLEQYNII